MKWKYILKRILIAIPTFFGITILAYFILNMAPGSPLDALLADPGITPAELERKRVALGLDQPVIIQYFTWLKQLLTGKSGIFLQHPETGGSDDTGASSGYCDSGSKLHCTVIDRIHSSWNLCCLQAEFRKRLLFRRSVYADDGDSELLCRTGIYLSVRHCV